MAIVPARRSNAAGGGYSAHVRLAAASLAVVFALALGACGDTVQERPIPHNLLEGLILAPFPVYWVGGSFRGMAVTETTHDPSGSFSVQYGSCLQGGQGTCVPPLRVVTSPDNSFLPGGAIASSPTRVRGVAALSEQAGTTLVIPTAGVVVDVYAVNARTARAAAATVVPINAVGAPGAPLARALPDTGFGATPLPSQVPARLRASG
jgi:hypothetical protein